jgi:hypothetical protein
MKVHLFKLTNNVELVAELLKETGRGYVVRRPLQVHIMRTPDGSPTMGFAPWSMIIKEDQEIELYDHTLSSPPLELLDEVATSYIQNVTGLLIPPQTGGSILHG